MHRVVGDDSWAPGEISHDVSTAAHIVASFLCDRFLRIPDQLPFSLATGDISQNLEDLKNGPDVTSSEVGRKIQILMRKEYQKIKMERGLELVRDINWTTVSVEQMHGLLSALLKLHKRYGRDMLSARAMLLIVRPLFGFEKKDRHSSRLRQRLARLRRRKPELLDARNEFLRTPLFSRLSVDLDGSLPCWSDSKWSLTTQCISTLWMTTPAFGMKIRLPKGGGICEPRSSRRPIL